jgi:prephenate dehydratase
VTKERVRIGFQGEPGAFSEGAVHAYDRTAEAVPRSTFQAVVDALVSGEAELGVLPVENSLAGGVTAAWDVLSESAVRVIGEVVIPVRLCLLGLPGAGIGGMTEARSHPVALAQCGRFLKAHPGLGPVAVYDTAGAAREVSQLGDPTLGAIASADAGERYGLECLAADIQDRSDNQTRFFVVRPLLAAESGDASELAAGRQAPLAGSPTAGAGLVTAGSRPPLKTALLAVTDDRPGALRDLLSVFADRALDLSHITSRPGGIPWTYAFVIEVRHITRDEVSDAITAARASTRSIRVLGTFPAARGGGS